MANSDGTQLGRSLGLFCWWCTCMVRTISMTKKSSGSSRRGKRISVSAESIFSKPPNKRQKAVLARIAKRQTAGDESGIDYSDIPPLSDAQLAQVRRAPK